MTRSLAERLANYDEAKEGRKGLRRTRFMFKSLGALGAASVGASLYKHSLPARYLGVGGIVVDHLYAAVANAKLRRDGQQIIRNMSVKDKATFHGANFAMRVSEEAAGFMAGTGIIHGDLRVAIPATVLAALAHIVSNYNIHVFRKSGKLQGPYC